MIYHLVPAKEWHAVLASNGTYYPATYDQDGFLPEILIQVSFPGVNLAYL